MAQAIQKFQRSQYPLRNQLVWEQCVNIWNNEIVLLGQANNISTPKMADLRHRLRQQNLFLRFPKPGILKAFLRQSPWKALEPAVIGPTFCAVSKCTDPSQLQAALHMIQAERNIILLGGKALDTEFTVEGMQDLIACTPSLDIMRSLLLGLIQSPALGLSQALSLAPSQLTSSLDVHAGILEGAHAQESEQ